MSKNKKKALVTNAADEKQVKAAAQRVKSNEQYLEDAYKSMLNQKIGRRVLWDILEECGVYQDIWEPSAKIHFNAGKRSVGLGLLAKIADCDEDQYLIMQKENRERKREEMNV